VGLAEEFSWASPRKKWSCLLEEMSDKQCRNVGRRGELDDDRHRRTARHQFTDALRPRSDLSIHRERGRLRLPEVIDPPVTFGPVRAALIFDRGDPLLRGSLPVFTELGGEGLPYLG
jgi:hypothetical protein